MAESATPAQIHDAREKLDAHVREIVDWHFDPKTGTPFWLERVKKLGFDPRKEVKGFDDLKIFGLFEDEWLRGGPVRRWVPKGLADRPFSNTSSYKRTSDRMDAFTELTSCLNQL